MERGSATPDGPSGDQSTLNQEAGAIAGSRFRSVSKERQHDFHQNQHHHDDLQRIRQAGAGLI
jgi:hypothetical protein